MRFTLASELRLGKALVLIRVLTASFKEEAQVEGYPFPLIPSLVAEFRAEIERRSI
jgi:hypothetical protein